MPTFQLSDSKGQISTNDGTSPGEVARTDSGYMTFKDRQKMFQAKINSNNPNFNSTEMNKKDFLKDIVFVTFPIFIHFCLFQEGTSRLLESKTERFN